MSSPRHPFEAMREVRTYPLASRPSLVEVKDFCEVPDPLPGFEIDIIRSWISGGAVKD